MNKVIGLKVKWVVGVLMFVLLSYAFAQMRSLATVSNQALFYRGLKVYSDEELKFRDDGVYLESGADGKLSIISDGTGNDDITLSGTVTFDARTTLAAAVADTNAFTTTATRDTVVVTGATVSSVFIVSGMATSGTVDQQDVLQWEAKTDTLMVVRLASGESALKYSWLWLR